MGVNCTGKTHSYLSLFLRGDNSVRERLDGPLLHMLNELRKEVSPFYPSVTVVTFICIARIGCLRGYKR